MKVLAKVFVVWYFGLWGFCSWLLFENFYPHQTYGVPMVNYLVIILGSFLLLVVTGGPLYYLFRRGEISAGMKKVLLTGFVLGSIGLFVFVVPLVESSAFNKARTQSYMDDLKNQGFNVKYSEVYPYGHWHVEYVDCFSDLTKIAEDIECENVIVHAGVPSFFMFYIPPHVEIVAAQQGQGYYMFVDSWYD
ncbi:MAG: hypothetical protein P8Y18_07905 [Candidatus Bathyarchaeota archaeon]